MNTPINQQTSGPLEVGTIDPRGLCSLPGFDLWNIEMGLCIAAQYPEQSDAPPPKQQKANARLLAASYTMLDRAGRELGIDATELAEKIDLAALLRAVAGSSDEEIRQWIDVNAIRPAHA